MIRLRVLGTTELHDADGHELAAVLAQPKRLALLAYLAGSSGFHRRDALHALFWPELDAARSREALNQAVRFLRKELRGSPASVLLNRGAGELGVDPGALWCDAAAFRQLVAARRHGEALDLYRGDLLPGFFAEQSAGFESWLDSERARLRGEAARAARAVAEARERELNFSGAVVAARRAAELAGLDERVLRSLLALLDRLGDRAGAIHVYEEFERRIAAELESDPAAETVALVDQIRRRDVASPVTPSVASTTERRAADQWTIVRELGRGGMATVYMARDAKHDRHVALKVLRPELASLVGTELFLREIQITAQLAHPHILPLIDSGAREGLPFLVTPYVSGESLRTRLDRGGPLPESDALRIAIEIAEALDYAHRCGIVHRDVKPENILLADGHAIVADFGIARAVAASGTRRGTGTESTGAAIGSPSYMSPEALGGHSVGTPTDIFALGCVLVEMLGGTPPERGTPASALARRYGIGSRRVAALAAECIAIDPAHRPRSAGEVARRLERLARDDPDPTRPAMRTAIATAAAAALVLIAILIVARGRATSTSVAALEKTPRDLAVLYFDDLTPDGRLGHVAAGLTEDLIDQLSQVEGLRVISPDGVRLFRDGRAPLDSVARRLDVSTIVTGSVSGAGPLLRLAVRLVDPRTGAQLRSHVVQRPMWDLFAMRDSMSDEVALWLREHLGRRVRLQEIRNATGSVDAWQAMYRAEELLHRAQRHDAREPALLREADSLLLAAQRLDPRWAEPATRRARIALARARMQPAPLAAVIALADSILRRHPDDADALAVRGEARLYTFLFVEGATDALLRDATADLRRAVSARPDAARPWSLVGDALLAENRYAEALDAYVTALNADAFLRNVRQVYNGMIFASAYAERFDDADRYCRAAQSRFPEDPRFVQCGLVLLGHRGVGAGDVANAWQEARRIDAVDSTGVFASSWSFRQMMVAAVLARSGLRDSARAVVARTQAALGTRPPAVMAEAYVAALLGDRDGALRLLGDLAIANPRIRIGLSRNPWFRALGGDPRFRALAPPP